MLARLWSRNWGSGSNQKWVRSISIIRRCMMHFSKMGRKQKWPHLVICTTRAKNTKSLRMILSQVAYLLLWEQPWASTRLHHLHGFTICRDLVRHQPTLRLRFQVSIWLSRWRMEVSDFSKMSKVSRFMLIVMASKNLFTKNDKIKKLTGDNWSNSSLTRYLNPRNLRSQRSKQMKATATFKKVKRKWHKIPISIRVKTWELCSVALKIWYKTLKWLKRKFKSQRPSRLRSLCILC